MAVGHLCVREESLVVVRADQQKLSGPWISAGDCCEVSVGMPDEVENVAVLGDAEGLSFPRFEGLPIDLVQDGNSLMIRVGISFALKPTTSRSILTRPTTSGCFLASRPAGSSMSISTAPKRSN